VSITAAELVAASRHVLLGFDGPVCAAFAGYGAADVGRHVAMHLAMGGVDVPPELVGGADPFGLLHFAAGTGDPDLLAEVDAEIRRLESLAVRLAPPTPGAGAVIGALVETGYTVTIVSDISVRAVRGYTRNHRLDRLIAGISGREDPDPSLLTPNPHLLLEAIRARGGTPDLCVAVGGSVAEVEAAHAVGVPVVALTANRDELSCAHPTALIDDIRDLLPPVSPRWPAG
jgi:phosphoglycolate phosphatase-like HAD superfamily hydrolase